MGYVLVPEGGYLIKDLATPPFFAKLALAYVAILAFAVAVVLFGGDADGATPLRGLVLR